MYESDEEMAALSQLLDASFAASSGHLLSIMEPHRHLSAQRIVAEMPSPAVLNLATVTAAGEPRISAVDGHFLHGHWHFGTAPEAVKAKHLRQRPAVSASYTPRDGYGVFCHGVAEPLEGPAMAEFVAHLADVYKTAAEDWAGIAAFKVVPHWMTGFALTAEEEAMVAEQRDAD